MESLIALRDRLTRQVIAWPATVLAVLATGAIMFGFASAIAGTSTATTPIMVTAQPRDARIDDLVQSGKIRVAIGLAPIFAAKNPTTGELRGVAVEMAQALAAKMGIGLSIVEYPRPGAVLAGLRDQAWDVGFQGIDPSRVADMEFTPAYMQVDLTLLVAPGSSVRKIADADETGFRIAVPRGDLVDVHLSRLMKKAVLVRSDTVIGAFELLRSGQADACALPLPNLIQHSPKLPGSRILQDRFAVNSVALAVPKGQAARLGYISEFIQEAKALGLVQQAMERAGLRGVRVADE